MANRRFDVEHRWGERTNISLPIYLATENHAEVRGHLKNLSLSGGLVNVPNDWRLHSLIEMRIALPERPYAPYLVRGHVARKLDADLGLEWCDFAPISIKELLVWHAAHLPAPTHLNVHGESLQGP